MELLYLEPLEWPPSCDSQQLAKLSPPHAISDESQLQASGAPAPCRVCAALSQPETEAVLEGPGVKVEFCPFLGAGPTLDQEQGQCSD